MRESSKSHVQQPRAIYCSGMGRFPISNMTYRTNPYRKKWMLKMIRCVRCILSHKIPRFTWNWVGPIKIHTSNTHKPYLTLGRANNLESKNPMSSDFCFQCAGMQHFNMEDILFPRENQEHYRIDMNELHPWCLFQSVICSLTLLCTFVRCHTELGMSQTS